MADLPKRTLGRTGFEATIRWELAKLDDLLDGLTRIEFTLRFTLSHPGLHTTIVGTSKLEHLQRNIEAAKRGPLPKEIVEQAKRRLAEVGHVSEALAS